MRMFWLGALSVAVLIQTQLPVPPAQKGPNVVIGRLVDAATDSPVSGAIVTLLVPGDVARPQLAFTPRNVMTTANGDFLFRDLPAGRYSIAASAFGYMPNEYPPHVIDVADGAKPVGVTVRLTKFAAIAGTVIDELGEAVAGVRVGALRRLTIGGTLVLRREGTEAETDDRGAYRISNLPPGSYVVGAVSSSMSMPASLAAELDGAASNREPETVTSELINSSTIVRTGEGVRSGNFVLQRPGPPPRSRPTAEC